MFLNHQYSTGISFLLLLLPNMISNVRQTNESIVGIGSEDFPSFSRNEPLRLLINALVSISEPFESILLTILPQISILLL